MNLLKLLFAKIFGGKNERIDGCNLFSNEYTSSDQFKCLRQLYGDKPIVRMPLQESTMGQFTKAAAILRNMAIPTIALLDEFRSHNSMMARLNLLKSQFPAIAYVELFNELPRMHYEGNQILTLQTLITLLNEYSNWIHDCMPNAKTIGMACYNSLDEETYPQWGGVSNLRVLKDIILYTTVDVVALHLYGDSIGKQLALFNLADNIRAWNDEAENENHLRKKSIWITETGSEPWDSHVPFYNNTIRLAVNVLKPEKVIWYRQTILNNSAADAGFALETQVDGQHSPLWDVLLKKV
jgi:hypothetical protein